ncbi:hypothetical protein ABFT23_08935 [Nocardioides sp. C4-1]|uniref:hypothetical protein n=1 Tax=Nocardioides sp. C4-1 TaxID=3151851 RepID=UPI0032670E4C
MSETDPAPEAIDDDQLPDDVRPGEDNPLADGLGDNETVGDLLTDGKRPEQSDDRSTGSQDGDDGAS